MAIQSWQATVAGKVNTAPQPAMTCMLALLQSEAGQSRFQVFNLASENKSLFHATEVGPKWYTLMVVQWECTHCTQ